MKILVLLDGRLSHAHIGLAAEASKAVAGAAGHQVMIECLQPDDSMTRLSEDLIDQADVVIVSSLEFQKQARSRNRNILYSRLDMLILQTDRVINEALRLTAGTCVLADDVSGKKPDDVANTTRVVAITACPTGIAHTFLAAEALRRGAEKMGYQLAVETQGSVGSKNRLTDEEIRRADVVIIAADTHVDTKRFANKRIYRTSTKEALHHAPRVIKDALSVAEVWQSREIPTDRRILTTRTKKSVQVVYQHLMTGVSHMLPLVTAGGLLIALSFAIGGVNASDHSGTLGWALMLIGGGTAFSLYVPMLAAFIAYSIADRPGLASGLVGGSLAMTFGAGFLGGIVAGFLAGYTTKCLNENFQLPENLGGLKPVLVVPLLSTLVVGLVMVFVVGAPAKILLESLTDWLTNMQLSSALIFGMLLGSMMALDMGGPINKAAYTFAVALLASKVSGPIAATMAAGMTPPLGLALATVLAPNRFSAEERNAGRAAAILGLSFITEGAIPFAANDPLRVIPSVVLGSATAGALTMAFGVQLMVPHGGVFALLIPHAVRGLGTYVVAILVGTLVTTAILVLVKRPANRTGNSGDRRE